MMLDVSISARSSSSTSKEMCVVRALMDGAEMVVFTFQISRDLLGCSSVWMVQLV